MARSVKMVGGLLVVAEVEAGDSLSGPQVTKWTMEPGQVEAHKASFAGLTTAQRATVDQVQAAAVQGGR